MQRWASWAVVSGGVGVASGGRVVVPEMMCRVSGIAWYATHRAVLGCWWSTRQFPVFKLAVLSLLVIVQRHRCSCDCVLCIAMQACCCQCLHERNACCLCMQQYRMIVNAVCDTSPSPCCPPAGLGTDIMGWCVCQHRVGAHASGCAWVCACGEVTWWWRCLAPNKLAVQPIG